jgi:hypothetical protein
MMRIIIVITTNGPLWWELPWFVAKRRILNNRRLQKRIQSSEERPVSFVHVHPALADSTVDGTHYNWVKGSLASMLFPSRLNTFGC